MNTVTRTILASLWQLALTVFIAVSVSFFALALVPGDPVDIRLGPLAKIPAAQREQIRIELGLNEPLWQQYLTHLKNLLTGNLGYSYNQHLEVSTIIARQAGHTLQLAAAALCLAAALVLLGQALLRYKKPWGQPAGLRDKIFNLVNVILTATPNYWLGFLLLMLFSVWLKWLPSGGVGSWQAIILPAITLALPVAGVLGQLVNTELNAVENTQFALSSRARGVSRARFAWSHGILHAVPSVGAVTVNIIGSVLGGAILVETVFARPGLGRVALDAVLARDMPVVLGLVALSALVFAVLSQLLAILITLTTKRGGH